MMKKINGYKRKYVKKSKVSKVIHRMFFFAENLMKCKLYGKVNQATDMTIGNAFALM